MAFFGGSVHAMISSIKMNKAMLERRSFSPNLPGSTVFTAKRASLQLKKLSAAQRQTIRRKYKKMADRNRLISTTFLVVAVLLTIVVTYIVSLWFL